MPAVVALTRSEWSRGQSGELSRETATCLAGRCCRELRAAGQQGDLGCGEATDRGRANRTAPVQQRHGVGNSLPVDADRLPGQPGLGQLGRQIGDEYQVAGLTGRVAGEQVKQGSAARTGCLGVQ